MSLHRLRLPLLGLLSAALVSACGGGGGSSAPAPQNVVATAGDTQVTLTWDMEPGVQYWMWYQPGTDVAVEGSNTFKLYITSPYVLNTPVLTNGTTYAFTLNGRTNNGPGGPGSVVQTATPRLAGADWLANGSLGSSDMRSLAYGLTPGDSTTHSYVAVGDAGSVYRSLAYTSTAPLAWTAATPAAGTPLAGVDLKAILYTLNKYIVVGAGGTVASGTDLATWTAGTGTGTARLNALAGNGSTVVTVGAAGTILRSTDGITWTAAATVPTSKELLGVTYSSAGVWVAVGAEGTLLTSVDANIWVAGTSGTAQDLKAVSAIASTDSTTSVTTYTIVAVGANGAVSTSSSTTTAAAGASWTAQTLPGAPEFNAVFAATRIVAIGTNGALFTSEDGSTWTPRSSPGNLTMYGLIRENNVFTAVGAAGRSVYSY